MSIVRSIVAGLLCVALLVAATSAHAAVAPVAEPGDSHACCKKDGATQEQSPQQTPKKCCESGACAMQCCRVIPVTPDVKLDIVGRVALIATVAPAIVDLHSMGETAAIFHPPRV